jgi:hypothetical protein
MASESDRPMGLRPQLRPEWRRFEALLASGVARVRTDPRVGAAILVSGGLGTAAIVLFLLPRGWSSYLALSAIAVIGVLIYGHWHGVGTAFKRLLALIAALGVIAGVTPIVGWYQRLVKGNREGLPVVKTFAPYGSPSYTVSKHDASIVRTCPRRSCRQIASLRDGAKVTMRCWVDTEATTVLYRSPRWFKISFIFSERRMSGFIHSSNVEGQARTPHCP